MHGFLGGGGGGGKKLKPFRSLVRKKGEGQLTKREGFSADKDD